MKNLLSLLIIVLLFSCRTVTRLGTEAYIKNNIQNHTVNEFSNIQTFSIGIGKLLGIEGKGGDL